MQRKALWSCTFCLRLLIKRTMKMASRSAPSPTMKSGKLGTRLEMSSSFCTLAADASSMVTLCRETKQEAEN